MKLHEYQTKQIFSQYGIAVPYGRIATNPREVHELAQEFSGSVVLKAQVLVSGRGESGGIRVAHNPTEALEHAQFLFNMQIQGLPVGRVLVEHAVAAREQLFLAITTNHSARCPMLVASLSGGVGVEEAAREHPELVVRQEIDPLLGLHNYQVHAVLSALGLPRQFWPEFVGVAQRLYEVYRRSDAELVEINPLVLTPAGAFVALDAKMIVDDNAIFRQPQIAAMYDNSYEPETEQHARRANVAYVQLDGHIGCMVNGAGLAMATMDLILLFGERYGIRPANFLDIGGGANHNRAIDAMRILLGETHLKAVLVNIFGGITRCDEITRGLIRACEMFHPKIPIIVRMQGTRAFEALEMIHKSQIDNLLIAHSLSDAARTAVMVVKDGTPWPS